MNADTIGIGTPPGHWITLVCLSLAFKVRATVVEAELLKVKELPMKRKIAVTAAVIFNLVWSMGASSGAGLECPKLRELKTSALASTIDTLLPKGEELDQPEKLSFAITLLDEHGLSTDDTINHLIALYCPAVAEEIDLSASEKNDRVKQFAQKATSLALSISTVDAIVFNIPLSPTIAEEARVRADQAGLTVEKWIALTVGAALR